MIFIPQPNFIFSAMVNPNPHSSQKSSSGARQCIDTRQTNENEGPTPKRTCTDQQSHRLNQPEDSAPSVAAVPENYEIAAPVAATPTHDLFSELSHVMACASAANPPENAVVDAMVRQ